MDKPRHNAERNDHPTRPASNPLLSQSEAFWNFCAFCGRAPQEVCLNDFYKMDTTTAVMVCKRCAVLHAKDRRASDTYRRTHSPRD